MAEGSKGRRAPWLAFLAALVVVAAVVAAFLVWQDRLAVAPEPGIDLDIAAPPALPPITPTPDPQPLPLPSPNPQPR